MTAEAREYKSSELGVDCIRKDQNYSNLWIEWTRRLVVLLDLEEILNFRNEDDVSDPKRGETHESKESEKEVRLNRSKYKLSEQEGGLNDTKESS